MIIRLGRKGIKRMTDEDITLRQSQNDSMRRRYAYLKRRRQVRAMRIFWSRVRMLIRLACIYFLCLGLWKFMHLSQWYLPSHAFSSYNSHRVEFEGNRITKNQQILNEMNKVKYPNKAIYLIDVEPFKNQIQKLAPVKTVYVKRFAFPARIKVIVEEHEPIFSVAPKPDVPPLAIFTMEGTIISSKYFPFEGMDKTYRILTYDDYEKWAPKNIKYLIYLAKMSEAYSGEKLKYIDMKNPDDVYIQLQTVSIRLGELDKSVFDRLAKVEAVMPQMKSLKEEVKYIDLRWEDSAFIKLKK